ncbi:MAG: chloride channel protein, partial [Planctomycetota bacterium]
MVAAIAGVGSGLAATLLEGGLHWAIPRFIGQFTHVGGSEVLRFHWALLVLPTAAGLFSGLVSLLTNPKLSHGTEAVVRAFHHGAGVLSLKDSIIKGTAAVVVIACGGSAGPEGPIAAIGAAIGSTLGAGLSPRERRIVLLAGCGGGVGAIFHCPLGGALFATTILYRDLDIEADALLLSLIASVVSFATFKAFWGYETPLLRETGALGFRVGDLAAYAALAILCAAGAALFRYSYDAVRRSRRRLPPWLAPAVGGLLVGAVALVVPQVMDARYVFIQGWLDGSLLRSDRTWSSWVVLLAIISAAKCVATGLTVGSGNAGGLLGPTVFIGGSLGALAGALLEAVFPGMVPEDLRRALVPAGMAGLLAASMRVPLAAIVMVTEMTGSYGL